MAYDAAALLKKHGKSFNFARLFLGKRTGNAAARLYGFCRIIDDIADDSVDKQAAKEQLSELRDAVFFNQITHPLVGDFLMLCAKYDIDRHNGITLIDGVTEDLTHQALQTEQDIIIYAYKVAGVVGLMMASILGAKPDGHAFAIDLGIAMQLTNIARDVIEDAHMGRRYVPGAWVNELSAAQIALTKPDDRQTVQHAINRLLSLAEDYYQSGLAGLYYLPAHNKRAIIIAAYVYRQIGRKLKKQNYQYWQGRIYVSVIQKVVLAVQALAHLYTQKVAQEHDQHRPELHTPLLDIYPPQHSLEDSASRKNS